MYTNFLRSLTAVIFSHVFASSLILIFVALYQAECYAALPFVHLLLESNFLPIYLYTYIPISGDFFLRKSPVKGFYTSDELLFHSHFYYW